MTLLTVYFIFILGYGNEKSKFKQFLLFNFKMGCKAAETTGNINNVFGPGTANECTVQWWFKKFAKETRALKMGRAVTGHQRLTTTS